MASESVNPRLVKSNIDLLARITKKPNMVTEKILARPPFKFLHDLITLIVKTTGYFRGLYSDEEFTLENVNNKDGKIAFLDKLIDVVGFVNGKAVDVKSSKIVAGVEVEKTNKLLNEMAKAILDKKPFVEAVEKVRKGLSPPAGPGAAASGPAKAGATQAAAGGGKKPVPTKAAPTKAAPAAKSRAAQPAAKAPPGKTTKAPTAGAKAAATKTKKEPETEPESEPEVSPKVSEPVSLESSATKSLEPESSIEPPVSEEAPPTSLIAEQGLDNSLDADESPKKPTTPIAPRPPPTPPVIEPAANLENNLDQLVAGLGLDDEDDEEEEEGLQAREETFNSRQPEDSGIDSKANSISTVRSEDSPPAQTIPKMVEETQPQPPPPQQQQADPTSVLGEEEVNPIDGAGDGGLSNSSSVTSASSSRSRRTMDAATADSRKRSATVKPQTQGRRASKSSIPPTLGSTLNGISSRGGGQANVPSSAAPATYGNLDPQSPPMYQQQEEPDDFQQPVRPSRMGTARSARPSSSRPAPPRVKTASRSRLTALTENRMAEQVTETAPEQVWPPPEGLKLNLDLDQEEDGDGDEYVMSSSMLQESLLKMDTSRELDNGTTMTDSFDSGPNKGRLVQQLLDTKSELEGGVVGSKKTSDLTPVNGSSTDTKLLRGNIQALCQSVGNLSKALNYLHEDVDPMMNELTQWRTEYRANEKIIKQIGENTAKEVAPLRKQLDSIELEVKEYAERLMVAKATVHRNALNIGKLIESI